MNKYRLYTQIRNCVIMGTSLIVNQQRDKVLNQIKRIIDEEYEHEKEECC